MYVTLSEFKENPDRYLDMSAREDVYVIRDGKILAKLTRDNTGAESYDGDSRGHVPEDGDVWTKRGARKYFRKFRKDRKKATGGNGAGYVRLVAKRMEIVKSLSGIIPEVDDETAERIISESIEKK